MTNPTDEAKKQARHDDLFYACDHCWHGMNFQQVYDQGCGTCPKCSQGTMREIERMNIPTPPVGATLLCLVCAYYKPWGIFNSRTGIAVCTDCRDAAQRAALPQPAGEHGWQYVHERQAELIRRDGLMCERHPGKEFEHDPECAGPGMAWAVEGKAEIESLAAQPQPAGEHREVAPDVVTWLKGQCGRYLNGQCMTRRCLVRGGYTDAGSVDYDAATCEPHEIVQALAAQPQVDAAAAAREIESEIERSGGMKYAVKSNFESVIQRHMKGNK